MALNSAKSPFSFYLSLQPHEHILSVLGRYRILSGCRKLPKLTSSIAKDTANSCPSAYARPIYENLLSAFSRSEFELAIMREMHTFENFYKPFLTKEVDKYSKKAVFPHRSKTFKHSQAWRWCTKCVREDIDKAGFPYFHLEHQLPAMNFCFKHNKVLSETCRSCGASWTKLEILPAPPLHNKCMACEIRFMTKAGYRDENVEWLQQTSLMLLSGDLRHFDIFAMKSTLQKKLDISSIDRRLTVAECKRIGEMQHVVDNYFNAQFYDFIFGSGIEDNFRKVSALSILKVAFQTDLLISPIIYLLIAKAIFGGLDQFLIEPRMELYESERSSEANLFSFADSGRECLQLNR